MLSDLRGYYDSKPMQRANYYAARRIFPNILRLVLTAHSSHEPNWMLTANQASRKLAQQPALRLRVLRDIADAFVGRDSQQYRAYLVLANEELTAILATWNRLVGSGNYIGSILNADQLLLFTLRPSEERDVPIRPVDSLAGQMEQAHHHALGFTGGGGVDDQATGDGG